MKKVTSFFQEGVPEFHYIVCLSFFTVWIMKVDKPTG